MRSIYTILSKIRYSTVFLIGLLIPELQSTAQTLLNDSFNYPAGNLYGNGSWVRYGSNYNNPLQVTDNNLTYEGYESEADGKSVKLSDTEISESLFKEFLAPEEAVTSGIIYYSALIRVESAKDNANHIISFVQKGWSDLVDGKTGTEFGKLFIQKGSSDSKFRFGVDRAGSSPAMTEQEYDLNTVYLVIVKYEITGNDIVSLFVNPTDNKNEPAVPDAQTTDQSGSSVSRGIMAIELRQGGTGYKPAPNAVIDALRVTRSYSEIFNPEQIAEDTPSITVSMNDADFGDTFTGMTYYGIVNVKGKNLKSDISVGNMISEDITFETAKITRQEASEGYDLIFYLTPSQTGQHTDTILLESTGAQTQKIAVRWNSSEAEKISDLATLSGKPDDGITVYNYTGEAVVSYTDGTNIYMQDATGGIRLVDEYGNIADKPKEGDKISNMFVTLNSSFGSPYIMILYGTTFQTVEQNVGITPETLTLAELKQNAARYLNTIVRVENVTFLENAGATIDESMTNPAISDGTADGRMNILDGTDIIGTTIPDKAVTLTGISTSMSAAIVAPRSTRDIDNGEATEPSLIITPDRLDMARADINTSVSAGILTVKATQLPGNVVISFTGKNRDIFRASETVADANGTTDVEILYEPTAIGKHEAYVEFMVGDGTEFYQRIRIEGVCIDPANPPAAHIEPATVPEFNAKVGESAEFTLNVRTENMPDFLSARILGESNGAFLINNTILPKEGESSLKITFRPKEEGTFTETLMFSSLELDTIYVGLSGKATTGEIEEKEGDELPLTTDNPLILLVETFDGQTQNKPVGIDGWKNIAMKGNRAWWGYQDANGENTAKVTAYKSNVPDGYSEDCEMLLVTPPLDFKNAQSKMFTFRVMGDLLLENQKDLLELCYIDMMDGEMYINPVELQMPNIPDLNGEWMEYHIDLDGQEIADVFFMGFRFKSTLGKDNTAVYYIDDVSFGRTDLPQIKPQATYMEFEAQVNKEYVSGEIEVTGLNLQEDIKIKVGGPNRSRFSATKETIPSGGRFAVKFKSDEIGVHEAYVKLSSRGAADVYIPIAVNCKEFVGIGDITFGDVSDIKVFSINGVRVKAMETCSCPEDMLKSLESGYYIITYKEDGTLKTAKVFKD